MIPTAQPQFAKTSESEDPLLLKVPPAGRGNRVGARRGSPREAGDCPCAPFPVPLAKRGEPAGGGQL